MRNKNVKREQTIPGFGQMKNFNTPDTNKYCRLHKLKGAYSAEVKPHSPVLRTIQFVRRPARLVTTTEFCEEQMKFLFWWVTKPQFYAALNKAHVCRETRSHSDFNLTSRVSSISEIAEHPSQIPKLMILRFKYCGWQNPSRLSFHKPLFSTFPIIKYL